MTHDPQPIINFFKPLCKRKFIWLRAKSIMFDWLWLEKKNRRVHGFFRSNEKLNSISMHLKIFLPVFNAYYACSPSKLILCLLLRVIYTHSTKRPSMLLGSNFFLTDYFGRMTKFNFSLKNCYWRLCFAFYLISISLSKIKLMLLAI